MVDLNRKSSMIFIILLCSILVIGCSKSSDTSKKSSGSGGSGDTKIEVTAVINAQTKDLDEIPYIKDISKEAGVNVDWTLVRSGWEEQKNPILSSGDIPDVFISAIDDEDIATYENLFLPLDDLIEEHAPNIKRMFDEMPEIKELATTFDGKIYGLPSIIPHRPESISVPMINREWLDNLELEAPTTFDELYDVLKAFKEEDPNQNGKNDEIPFDYNSTIGQWGTLEMIGAYGNYTYSFFDNLLTVKDDEFIFLPTTEDYKKLINFMNKLYEDELLNQEVITQDWSQFNSRSKGTEAATVGLTFGWSIEQRVGQWKDQYEILMPVAADSTITPLWMADPIGLSAQVNRAVVAKDTENPEKIIEWLDGFYTEESSAQGYYGSFDIGVEEKDGQYVVLPPQDGATEDEWKWTNSLVDQGLMYISEELNQKLIPPSSIKERLEQDQVLSEYYPETADILPKLKFSPEERNELSIIRNDLENLVNIKWAEWISEGGVDDNWDSYIEELNNMGLERFKEIYQNAYDNY
ncbi:ABC transporter substrate-binding protein [Bacillus sp. J14TS2]|uniref:extracellular solute-binding protein n=1 Tax=Bacillus sp. J14TS2 TaxID=2807188 RepID=UPI001B1A4130|nr:extracellular solute-binding protein [Bacillus sp. J14TS2]GIN71547.1 ABC transporter substrate-binding protein [Bacillus sp. J14TS2]